MTLKHTLYALLVALMWGSNFIAIKIAYNDVPPFLLLTIRFILAAFPLIFFIPRPKTSLAFMFKISATFWVGQFSLLFMGIYLGMSAGLAALVMQCQTIFTLLLSIFFLGIRPSMTQVLGVTLALLGIVLIASQTSSNGTYIACLMVVGSALFVSISNLLFNRAGEVNMLSLVVWTSLIPPLPMFALSLLFEGWDQIVTASQSISLSTYAAILYTVGISTIIATTLWGSLMRTYTPSKVVPFTLVIPLVSMGMAALMLEEKMSSLDIIASVFIISGLIINQFSTSRFSLLISSRKSVDNSGLNQAA